MVEEGLTLEYTPTWVVASVCTVIVAISLVAERLLHYTGKYLKKKNQKPLFQALQKIKEELMLLGFISLLLAVFQSRIEKLCISENLAKEWLPCKLKDASSASTTTHFQTLFTSFIPGRLLAEATTTSTDYCAEMGGKVPVLSPTALHHLHIFIFVLAVVHVTFCALTILFGGVKIRLWKHWEDSISKKENDPEEVLKTNFTQVQDHDFIRNRFLGIGKDSALSGWVHSFFKQFYGSVTKTDYLTMRLGFIMTHCRGNPQFNFHKYMIRTLEADFRKVVGISWYLWLFVVIFLVLNVSGRHAYFWISFIPFIVQYGFDSCMMGEIGYIIPRLVIGAFIQFVCSYSTLPLYVIVTQMGSSYKKAIFEEHIQEGLVGWVRKAKKNKGLRKASNGSTTTTTTTTPGSTTHASSQMNPKETTPVAIQMSEASAMEEGNAGEIAAATLNDGHS
ncbi:hypothetical protein ACB092_04G001000 [Castanea dentata]